MGQHFTRRNFIGAVGATGAATVADFTPLNSLANSSAVTANLNPDRQITILSTGELTPEEQRKIKAVAKNIDLVVADGSSAAIEDAEVIIGDINNAMLQRASNLKWVLVTHAGVENIERSDCASAGAHQYAENFCPGYRRIGYLSPP